jgi:putative transposase
VLEIAERYDLTFEQVGDDKNHIHVLMSFHPKYSTSEVVRLMKDITARQLFLRLPELKKELWGGEFWDDSYYASTIGTSANWTVVERYVRNQDSNARDLQLRLWP